MAKQQRHLRAAKQGHLTRVEQNEVFDDNLLPDAAEIERLHQIDSGILPWLKERAEKEQEFRHEAHRKRTEIIDNHNAKEHTTVRLALFIYFFLVLGAGTASFFLIREGFKLEGSIFGGTTLVLALAVLVTRKPKKITASQ